MSGPRSYTDKTIKRLFGLARNKCSFPSCEREMSDENSAKDSNICHIEAANEGGQRWNPDMDDVQRADYENLMLLCPPHHEETNDVDVYPVEVLKDLKNRHEREMELRCSMEKPLSKRPSLLAEVISKIAESDLDELHESVMVNSFSVEDKISYNQIVENAPIIQEYSGYQGKINSLYSEFERNGDRRKSVLLRNIKHVYLVAKGNVLGVDQSIEGVREHSDKLINYVKRTLHELVDESVNSDASLSYEDVEFAVSIIMIDGFMRCKILEEPKSDY